MKEGTLRTNLEMRFRGFPSVEQTEQKVRRNRVSLEEK